MSLNSDWIKEKFLSWKLLWCFSSKTFEFSSWNLRPPGKCLKKSMNFKEMRPWMSLTRPGILHTQKCMNPEKHSLYHKYIKRQYVLFIYLNATEDTMFDTLIELPFPGRPPLLNAASCNVTSIFCEGLCTHIPTFPNGALDIFSSTIR
jgi:hypothetical protein